MPVTNHVANGEDESPFGISASFLSAEAAGRGLEKVFDAAHTAIFDHDTSWREWMTENLNPDEFWVMHFEDRDRPRKLVKADSAYFYVPASAVSGDPTRQAEQMKALIAEFLRAIGVKRGVPPAPASPA